MVFGARIRPTYWETQAISSSVLNTIWLVLLLCITSPFTRQQIFRLCGSETKNDTFGILPSAPQPPPDNQETKAQGGLVTCQGEACLLGSPPWSLCGLRPAQASLCPPPAERPPVVTGWVNEGVFQTPGAENSGWVLP